MSEKLRCPNCGGNLKVANKLIEESEDDFRNLQISTTKTAKERQEYFMNRVAELQAQVKTGMSAYSDLLLNSAREIESLQAQVAEINKWAQSKVHSHREIVRKIREVLDAAAIAGDGDGS